MKQETRAGCPGVDRRPCVLLLRACPRPAGSDARMTATHPKVELLVCTACRVAGQVETEGPRPGALLLTELSGKIGSVALTAVECLSNCSRGCTIALRAPGRWTYVYGNIDPAQHLDAVIAGTWKYSDAPDGLVPWRERPDHFRKNCIARIPPLEAPHVA